MSAPAIKGYCPGALTPMMSGDGLVVRVRPFDGQLTAAQTAGLAGLAQAHGNGLLDVSSRANLQIRGVTQASYAALITGLEALDLLDPTAQVEARRNIVVTPFWQPEDQTLALSQSLTQALSQDSAPDLPKKFGFAIDTGPTPVLRDASADIRLERSVDGGLVIAADGASVGRLVPQAEAIDAVRALLDWFMARRGAHRRMAALIRQQGAPPHHSVPLQPPAPPAAPGLCPQGALVGAAFGQMTAQTLAGLGALRMTPWRMVLLEGAVDMPDTHGLITDPADPLLRVTACTGAPRCGQAFADVRPLARRLAAHVPSASRLHVSGCAKGCAHPRPAPVTITATAQGFDLIRDGRAHDTPLACGLTPDALQKAI